MNWGLGQNPNQENNQWLRLISGSFPAAINFWLNNKKSNFRENSRQASQLKIKQISPNGRKRTKTDAITTAIFNAGVTASFYGSALWQLRQFVFDDLTVKQNMNKQIGYLSVEKTMFQSPAQNIAQPLGVSEEKSYAFCKYGLIIYICTYLYSISWTQN